MTLIINLFNFCNAVSDGAFIIIAKDGIVYIHIAFIDFIHLKTALVDYGLRIGISEKQAVPLASTRSINVIHYHVFDGCPAKVTEETGKRIHPRMILIQPVDFKSVTIESSAEFKSIRVRIPAVGAIGNGSPQGGGHIHIGTKRDFLSHKIVGFLSVQAIDRGNQPGETLRRPNLDIIVGHDDIACGLFRHQFIPMH